jgi:hypothetical protein
MKRAYDVLWITKYLQDIQADFFAIYHIPDWESLDGPLFISLTERLPFYEGALQGRIKTENDTEEAPNTDTSSNDTQWVPGQTISISEAVSGDAQLLAMQEESVKQGWGNLFDIQKG